MSDTNVVTQPTAVASLSVDPVSLTDAATVALDASAGAIFSLTATAAVGRTRQLALPTGVPSGKAQSLVLFFKQDAVGGRLLAFPAAMSPAAGVDTTPNAVTRLTLTTLDGGSTWNVEGGGVVTGPFAHVVTGPTMVAFAASAIRVVPLGVRGAPASGEVWPSIAMPWAGTVLGIRPTLRGTGALSVGGTLSVNNIGVAGLISQTYGASTARTNAVNNHPSHNFVAGDVLNFTHTAAPGGTLTDVILAVEVVQR